MLPHPIEIKSNGSWQILDDFSNLDINMKQRNENQNSSQVVWNYDNSEKRDLPNNKSWYAESTVSTKSKQLNEGYEQASWELQSNSRKSIKNKNLKDKYLNWIDRKMPQLNKDKELLTITVEIGNGKREEIVIRENDNVQEVSDQFCK